MYVLKIINEYAQCQHKGKAKTQGDAIEPNGRFIF
jgi:hypothetical protein